MDCRPVQGGGRLTRRLGFALLAIAALLAVYAQSAGALGGGQIGTSFGTPGVGNGQFFNPGSFGADPVDGTLYTVDYNGVLETEASNYRIQQLSSSGEFKASAEIKRFPTSKKIIGLQGVAVDHDLGRIYLVETCRLPTVSENFNCKESQGKFGARKILVYSTTPSAGKLVPDGTLPTIALPEGGGKQIYNPQAVAVDPNNHDIVILGEDFSGKKVIQRVSSTGTFGNRFTDSTGKIAQPAGPAVSLAVGPTGTAYTASLDNSSGAVETRLWQLPQSLASIEAVPGVAAAQAKENWTNDFGGNVEPNFGGPQMAISPDGSTLYFKELITASAEKEPGEFVVRAYSLSKGETTGLWGGGTGGKCNVQTTSAALAALPSGNLAVFDFGAPTAKTTDAPAFGRKVATFGPSGTGCKEPVAKFTINGKPASEEPTGIKPGDTVTFSAASSELAGGFRKQLIWKFGDGTEQVVGEPSEGVEAPATVTHKYTSAAKVTVRLEIKLAIPSYGNPAAVERSFNVGTPVSNFKLKVVKGGTGSGGVASSPAGIACGATCEAEFASGTEVTLTATADAGSQFSGWSGAGCSGTGTCKVTMSEAKEVTANFALETRQLKVTKSGSGGGTVKSSPTGIDCGLDCFENYDYNKVVTLTAEADGSSVFKGWSGGGCSGTGSCEVTMTLAHEVNAQFDATSKFTLKVKKTGIGFGPVTSSPAGIDCRSICQASFNGGSTVVLDGTPGAGTKALVWTGCDEVVGSNDCKVVLNANREVTAFFDGVTCTGANVTGTGSSLQAPAHSSIWKPNFEGSICDEGTFPTVTYNGTGSGAGMAEWNYDGVKGSINTGLAFIGTDDAPSAPQIANVKSKAGSAEVAVIPVAQTAIAVIANLPAGCDLEGITNGTLAGVMEGRIANWSKVEGAEGSCNAPITRVVRKDASGTTAQLKNYLQRLYAKGLFCTTGSTEGKASWAQLANTAWPESCPEKSLGALLRPASNGGSALVSTVNATDGAIGYAGLPDAVAAKGSETTILDLQNNGQKKGAEANFAAPNLGTVANCSAMTYQVPKVGGVRDVDWSGVLGAKPAIGGLDYPLCTLTYALAFHGYQAAGFGEGQAKTVRDYLYGYIVQPSGQSAINGGYYAALPGSSLAQYDVLTAARNAAASISW